MKIKGIKRGQTIELLQEITDIADGEEVIVEISSLSSHPLAKLTPEQRESRINQVLGAWQNNSEIDTIFSEIDRSRHDYEGRPIDSWD